MRRALAELTTLRLGGPCDDVVEARCERDLIDHVSRADAEGTDVLLVGGGSNLVVADAGFTGRVVLLRGGGFEFRGDDVTVSAGQGWDDFVAHAVEQRRSGVEALSGIPGFAGATPIQNVGAYGQEISQTLTSVRAWDRRHERVRELGPDDCGFGYRTSWFKRHPGRYVILSVSLRLAADELSAPIEYPELARRIGVEAGQRAPVDEVRETVLALRRGKGMVLDDSDHDTWSAGSFFTNPVVPAGVAASLPAGAPKFAQADGRVKTSAAWLIEQAGFSRGYGTERVRLSTKHTLALTNRGGASTAELLDVARTVRDGVYATFGISLVNEPVLVGCDLDPAGRPDQ